MFSTVLLSVAAHCMASQAVFLEPGHAMFSSCRVHSVVKLSATGRLAHKWSHACTFSPSQSLIPSDKTVAAAAAATAIAAALSQRVTSAAQLDLSLSVTVRLVPRPSPKRVGLRRSRQTAWADQCRIDGQLVRPGPAQRRIDTPMGCTPCSPYISSSAASHTRVSESWSNSDA